MRESYHEFTNEVASANPLAADAADARRVQMLPLDLGCDAADDSWTQLGISRKLGGDVAEKLVSISRRGRPPSRRRGSESESEIMGANLQSDKDLPCAVNLYRSLAADCIYRRG
jgi:hypothetical protein